MNKEVSSNLLMSYSVGSKQLDHWLALAAWHRQPAAPGPLSGDEGRHVAPLVAYNQ